jgi:hypothetical protein
VTASRNPSVEHVARLLDPNPNLPVPLGAVAVRVADMRDELLTMLGDGPELTAGLRKLLEAKDCFVRQALIDSRERSTDA